MFTGIVEEVGTVRAVRPNGLVIQARTVMDDLALGHSIAVNGACLTVVERTAETFAVDLSEETLRRTNLEALHPGSEVNLERALAAGQHMGGHIVQGHVDATGQLVSLTPEEASVVVRIQAPPQVMRYVVEKAFIAVDGISLTVTGHDSSSFAISVIPYTRQHTNLRSCQMGQLVNLEVDILAKYVERLLSPG
ncbi:MAG: riboflavin synthase [Chloroflexi bacterium]|nr:riboflavin synthase [Chloroflexota bacterium]